MAQALLLKDVESLGKRGTVVEVSQGYLRNYLQPRKLAAPASKASLQAAQERLANEELLAKEAEQRASEWAALLNKTVLTIAARAGEDGKLFGSITNQDIVKAIKDARDIKLDRRKVKLEDPIRTVGTHMVTVEIAGGLTATVKTMIVDEQ